MTGFFHELLSDVQFDLHLWMFAEDVTLKGETFDGIIRVMESEDNGTGQAVILKGEVLLKSSSVGTVRTTESLTFRGQTFQIEAVGPPAGGVVKVLCRAKRKETTSFNGRR